MSETTPAPRAHHSRPRRRALVGAVLVVLAALVLALILSRCAHGGAAKKGGAGGPGGGPGGRPAITVGTAKAVTGAIPIEVSALGTVTPLATISVNARVAGMLLTVNFREGQLVRKGQLLAQIDPRPFQVAVQQAQGQLLRDQALLADAKLDLVRYRTLKAQDSIAGQQVDTQAALVKQDEATVSSDHAAVANAQLSLSFTHITAPVSGRVGLRQIDPGNQITANAATPIAVVAQIDPISVIFSLPEADIGSVTRNAGPKGGGLPVTALDRAGGTVLARGILDTLDNVIDTTTGTVKAKARFANGAGALFPNQFVNATMLVDTLQNQVIVPTTATRHGPQGDFVWVLQPDRTVKAAPVKVGPGTAETVSIASGLNAGQTVITEGGDRLREGAKVTLPGQRPAAGFGGRGHHHGGGAPAAG
ncbi:MAG: MdtA/MuxA family multidrug efflux RND transporter periplasmic adaptor subunit [Pseudomonadota bacterium]|nr:MdtA/MuxA family multidrug efflux RND transporter periplasmic adaptor subunit [Pseudomonadota bacterium]